MTAEATPLPIRGLSTIAGRYRALLCDVWGVVHNGVAPFAPAVDALSRFRGDGGAVLLISNAPRPSWSVVQQLDGLGVDRTAYDGVLTSGDVAADDLRRLGGIRLYHLGPDRDLSLYQGLAAELSDPDSAAIVCCTGLVDDETETVDDYRGLLSRLAARGLPMICANPDLVVERGNRLIPCAGALAAAYAEIGGKVTVIGKPYPAIYVAALDRLAALAGTPLAKADILAIGDGVGTDVRGANETRLDVLFISQGIHAAEFGDPPSIESVTSFLRRHAANAMTTMPRLAW